MDVNNENKNTDGKTKVNNQEATGNMDIIENSNNKNNMVEGLSEKQLSTNYGKTYKVNGVIKLDDETELEKTFYFKKPSVASFDRYLKSASNSSSRALRIFVQDNIINEQEQELNEILEEYPAFTLSLGEKLLEMLGLAKEMNVKKL